MGIATSNSNDRLLFVQSPAMLGAGRQLLHWSIAMGDKSPKSKDKNKKQKDSVKEQSKKNKDAQTAAKAKK